MEVIKFSLPACPPCRVYGPIFDEVAKTTEGVEFKSYDAREERELSAKFNVRRVPVTFFVKDGTVVERLMGVLTETQLKRLIKKYK